MDAALDESSVDDVTQTETRIVSRSRDLLPTGSRGQILSELDEILHPLGVQTKLLVVERANSIALYIACMTFSAVMGLRVQWSSGQLRRTIELLFTFLSRATRTIRVKRLTWSPTDYERCLQFFNSVQGKEVTNFHPVTLRLH